MKARSRFVWSLVCMTMVCQIESVSGAQLGRYEESLSLLERQLHYRTPARSAMPKAAHATIRRLAQESLREATVAICDGEGYPWGLSPTGWRSILNDGTVDAVIALSGRRYSRIKSLIAELPAAKRGLAARSAFDQALTTSRDFLSVAPGLPESRKKLKRLVGSYGCKWGMTSGLFLVACFGGPRAVCDCIETQRSFNREAEKKLRGTAYGDPGRIQIGPAIQGNALIVAIRQEQIQYGDQHPSPEVEHGLEQRRSIARMVADLVEHLRVQTVTTFPWDATITDSDRPHLRGRATVSEPGEDVVMHWGLSSHLVDQLIELVRTSKAYR